MGECATEGGTAARSVSACERPPLDSAALARLDELDPNGRNGLVARVLQTYVASLERLIGELQQARVAGRSDVVRRVAHTLKSSSASVGALPFAALCERVEAALREPQPAQEHALLDELQAESQRVARAVRLRLTGA